VAGGTGAGAAFVFVGVGPTVAVAAQPRARMSRCTIVGVAGGSYEGSFFTTPYESTLTNPYWGTIEELHEVVDMYRAGQIVPDIERYSLDDGLDAYRKLQAGELSRRAVIVPHGN